VRVLEGLGFRYEISIIRFGSKGHKLRGFIHGNLVGGLTFPRLIVHRRSILNLIDKWDPSALWPHIQRASAPPGPVGPLPEGSGREGCVQPPGRVPAHPHLWL